MAAPPCVNILGVEVAAQTLRDATARLLGWARADGRRYVCVADANVITEAQRDPGFRTVLGGAAMVTTDGMPLVWTCRLRGIPAERVYGPDLMLAACAASVPLGLRHVLFGSTERTLEALEAGLRARAPGLVVAARIAPPFRPLTAEEDADLVARINAARPDILWVGLGAPKQERWMADHLGRLEAPVMVGVGAAFDFLSGAKPQAPGWMRRNGLEWCFRLATEPRRLASRYARCIPAFIGLSLCQALGLRRFPTGRGAADGG
ncbi:WecB/TagA/CpsF family glycosyltransferase [Roseomonas stagni]|uniref:WecB/TagA/CpsF family glycosyltransferase n=1 Tax=Falsiroseomonas algicola TaxID=2716930 RepID=A0A6M1LWC1_9PROT|nr:WecB/TagA/CpsF family glycosyltransferase [Falsiroseomonas algicola]